MGGWWQGDSNCGGPGYRSFNAASATYHCCLPFEASFGTTQAPDPVVFIKEPETGYPYASAADALNACQAVNAEYSLCADYEIIEAATLGVASVEGWEGVDPQHNLCYTSWTDPDRSVDYLSGWYVHEGTCAGGEGWKSWMLGGTHAGAYCCYAPAFSGPPIVTEEPKETTAVEETDAPATEAPVDPTEAKTEAPMTEAPTDAPETTVAEPTDAPVVDSLPSSVANPSDCVDTGFSVEGFESVVFCEAMGTVYLNGRDTCVPSGGDQTEMYSLLQDVWDNSWYLASGDCTGDKTYDEATGDQLWITNEMCNNLEEDIEELETSTSEYMSAWTQSVIDLVNAQMSNFDADTQQALSDYLETLQN